MNNKAFVLVSIALLSLSLLILSESDGSSSDEPEETWYCYGDVMLLKYPYDDTGLTVSWFIVGYNSGQIIDTREETGKTVALNVGSYDRVLVTQVVTEISGVDSDRKVIEVIPLGLKSTNVITVRFMDGVREIQRYTLDGSTSVMLGNAFVVPPEDPTKTNYRFTGWYMDQACTRDFSPYVPILSDTTVYAGWESTGSSGSMEVSGYIVTFNVAEGLSYEITAKGDRALSFIVSVKDGYRFDPDSISASVGTTKITPVGGVYTLTGITKDTVIEITGDRLYNVSYDMSNVSISSEDLGKDSLSVSFSPSFGWSGVSLKVIMGGADVTSQYVNGSSVDIDQLSGDVIIMAQADLPWIYVLIIVIIVAIALVAVLLSRKRKSD